MRLAVLIAAAIFAGSLATAASAKVVVSSKIDTEGGVLGNVIALALKANGIEVEDRIQLGGTPVVRKAITAGEIDIYPEYTGNAAFFFNKADDPVWKDGAKGYEAAKKLDYNANKIVWLTAFAGQQHLGDRTAQGGRGLGEGHDAFGLRQVGHRRRQGQARRLRGVRQFRRGPPSLPDGLWL